MGTKRRSGCAMTDGMTLWRSLLFFGVPGLAVLLGTSVGVPAATARGVPLIVSWTLALWLPVLLLLALILQRFWRTSPPGTFRRRFRFRPMTRRDWAVVIGALLAVQLCELVLAGTGAALAGIAFFAPPSILPELFDPALDPLAGLATFFDIPVAGNWWLILFWLGWLVVNIGGEELLWRGYALPLQERAFGKAAWLINGLCWNLLFHAFMRWNVIVLMPVSLAIPYLVQRFQNTWIGICIHGIGNLLVLSVLIPSIAAGH